MYIIWRIKSLIHLRLVVPDEAEGGCVLARRVAHPRHIAPDPVPAAGTPAHGAGRRRAGVVTSLAPPPPGARVGSGRIVASEIGAPNMLVILVQSG